MDTRHDLWHLGELYISFGVREWVAEEYVCT